MYLLQVKFQKRTQDWQIPTVIFLSHKKIFINFNYLHSV